MKKKTKGRKMLVYELQPEPELLFGFTAPWSRSRKKYVRLRST
jgi:hypothetical protein